MTVTITPAQEYFARAEQLFNQGDFRDAARHYRRAWELDASLERAILYIGDCCFRLGDFFTALQFFREALLRNQTDHQAWMFTGDTYLRLGRPELAIPFVERAMQLSPNNPRLQQMLQQLPEVSASLQRYFEERLATEDRWTGPIDQQRTAAFRADVESTSEGAWTRLCFFNRQFLEPRRFKRVEEGLNMLLHPSEFPEMKGMPPDQLRGAAERMQTFIEKIRSKVAQLEKSAGPPYRYRFDACDGAPNLGAAAVRQKIIERRQLLEGRPQEDELGLDGLLLKGLGHLETFLGRLGDEPANALIEKFTFAISEALAARNSEEAQALALGEMELTMCFAQAGLSESENLPGGEGVSEGADRMDSDQFMEAMRFIQDAATPEEAVREAKARGWHLEMIFNALAMMGPQMYILYAADYAKAYDLSKKMVLLSDLLPEHLRRFPLRAFYRLQGLASLTETATKLGLHEETINAGANVEATVKEMGPDWRNDLPQYPGNMLRLGEAQLPEEVLSRAYTLMSAAYRSLGDTTNADATAAKVHGLGSSLFIWRGHLASSDCLALLEELRENGRLESAIKFAYMALSMDERKYREAGVQFHGNYALAEMMGALGLPRLQMIHWLRALAAAVEMNIPFNILFCLNGLGQASEQFGDHDGAEYFYRRAVRRIEAQSPLQGSMSTARPAIGALYRLALLIERRAPEEARSLLARAIGVLEVQREAIKEDLNAAGFGSAGSEIYAELIDLNLDAFKDTKEAFAVLERSKIRALLDQFAKRAASEQEAHPPAQFENIRGALVNP